MVLGIKPPIIEVDIEESMRHCHPGKEVVVVSVVIVHLDRLAPGGTPIKAPA